VLLYVDAIGQTRETISLCNPLSITFTDNSYRMQMKKGWGNGIEIEPEKGDVEKHWDRAEKERNREKK
jgi:hypothetical protein